MAKVLVAGLGFEAWGVESSTESTTNPLRVWDAGRGRSERFGGKCSSSKGTGVTVGRVDASG